MGVLPSTQPVATLGSSFILSSFDMACPCCVPYQQAPARRAPRAAQGHTLACSRGWGLNFARKSVTFPAESAKPLQKENPLRGCAIHPHCFPRGAREKKGVQKHAQLRPPQAELGRVAPMRTGVHPGSQPLSSGSRAFEPGIFPGSLSSSFVLSSFDLACTCCVLYVEATVFGVGVHVGSDDCNDDGRTSPRSAVAMKKRRGEHCAQVRMKKLKFQCMTRPRTSCVLP